MWGILPMASEQYLYWNSLQWNRICFENTACRILEFLLWQVHHDNAFRINGTSQWTFSDLVTLTFDLVLPMTLTYQLYLDILPLDLHAKIQVRTSVRSTGRVHSEKKITVRAYLTLKLPCGVQWTPHNIPTAVKVKRKMTWQRYFR